MIAAPPGRARIFRDTAHYLRTGRPAPARCRVSSGMLVERHFELCFATRAAGGGHTLASA